MFVSTERPFKVKGEIWAQRRTASPPTAIMTTIFCGFNPAQPHSACSNEQRAFLFCLKVWHSTIHITEPIECLSYHRTICGIKWDQFWPVSWGVFCKTEVICLVGAAGHVVFESSLQGRTAHLYFRNLSVETTLARYNGLYPTNAHAFKCSDIAIWIPQNTGTLAYAPELKR